MGCACEYMVSAIEKIFKKMTLEVQNALHLKEVVEGEYTSIEITRSFKECVIDAIFDESEVELNFKGEDAGIGIEPTFY